MWPCGHLIKTACNGQRGEWPCNRPCDVTLDCGHVCKGTCGSCWSGRVHVACKEKCGRALPGCGHKCRLPCGTECLPCQEKSCGTSCRHSNCKQPCGTPCPPCSEACPWKSCRHQECDALCHQPCPPCTQPCGKKLKCGPQDPPEGQGHSCSGLCGEKCFCFTCDRKNFVPLVIDGVLTEEESVAVGEDTKLIKLPRCGHIFNVAVLDVYVTKKCQNLQPGCSLTCPVATCNKMILEADCWRYNRLLRERHDRLAADYHWRELPQVSFLSRQKLCLDKYVFCRDKSVLATTKVCRDKNILVATSILWSRQTRICRDKNKLAATQLCLPQQIFAGTKICLSRQTYFCHDKRRVFVETCVCHDKNDTFDSSGQ